MKKSLVVIAALFCLVGEGYAKDNDLVLKKVMLYSSGVGYYEFEGNLDKESKIDLYFTQEQIKDVLKSITIASKSVNSLQFDYDSLNAHYNILDGLRIDPTRAVTLNNLLLQQRGAIINIDEPYNVSGKILSLNEANTADGNSSLSIFSDGKIITFDLNKIKSFSFADESLNKELEFALATIQESESQLHKKLTLNIKSNEKNSAKIGYVIASPVWKISYRLYAKDKSALFQAWAIVDNDTTNDWDDVNLVLMTGKPNSFVQDLYSPFYQAREIINIDGTPQIPTSDYDASHYQEETTSKQTQKERLMSPQVEIAANATNAKIFLGSDVFTANTKDGAAEQFSFAPSKPVTLKKSKSMMIPLVSTEIPVEKFSIFTNMPFYKEVNPKLALYLKNKSNMKLPAGAITLYDTEGYMGDAYIDYMNINDDKIISFGDDLSIKGIVTSVYKDSFKAISIKKGAIRQSIKGENISTYEIRNLDTKPKTVIIEYARLNSDGNVTAEIEPYKKTATYYRYKLEIPAEKNTKFIINESRIFGEQYYINDLDEDMFTQYFTKGEIPKNVRAKLEEIIAKKANLRKMEDEIQMVKDQQQTLLLSQERSRKNLEAVGTQSNEATQFLNQILEYDKAISEGYKKIEELTNSLNIKKGEFEKFMKDINI